MLLNYLFPAYSTGDIAEGSNYTFVCPSQLYFHIYDAYYGAPSVPCVTTDPLSVVRTSCHGNADSCNIVFNDGTFGGDPCGSNPSAEKHGSVSYFCASEYLGHFISF